MPQTQEGSAPAEQTSAQASILSAQGITGPTEAELRGETISDTEEKATDTMDLEDGKQETEEKSVEEGQPEVPKVTEKTAPSEPKAKEIPPGLVPLEAVHQARGEIRYLKEQLQAVQDQMRTMQAKPVTDTVVEDSFEVLTDEQFEMLAEDDATQAAIYLRNLNRYEANKRSAADEAKRQANFEKEYDSIIDTAVTRIEEVAPGIYDEGSTVQKELMEFAGELGFSEDLYYLTNPSTKIILPGESEPLLLGEQAASILGVLVKAKAKTVAPDNSALEASLRKEITEELMAKFKSTSSPEYRALNQVPKVETAIPENNSFAGKVLTTKQLLKLTDPEMEAYLAGN